MKRLLLLSCLCFIHVLSNAATLSGSVVYMGTSHPASGLKIFLADSSNTTHSIVYMDSLIIPYTGSYSFTIPATITSGYIRTYVMSCGTSVSSGYYAYTGSNLSMNLSLGCPVPQVVDTVRYSVTGVPISGQKVFLVDSTASFYYIDSQYTNSNGYVAFNIPSVIITDSLRIFAAGACGFQSHTFWFNNAFMAAPALNLCSSNALVFGTLTNVASSAVITGQKVCLVDSLGGALLYKDSMYTNASGVYSFIIPAFLSTGNVSVYTQGCGTRVINTAAFSGTSLSLNLPICSSGNATVSGQLTNITTSAAIAGQKVFFKDSVSSAVVFRDSLLSNANGMYSFNIPASASMGYCSVFTPSCSGGYNNATFSGSNLTLNLSIYPGVQHTFSGVIYETSGLPANNVEVEIYQYGVAVPGVTAYTNSAGAYSLDIPCSWPIPATITMYTYRGVNGCGAVSHFQGANNYTGGNIILNDTLCPVIGWTIGGTVFKQGGGVASNAKLYLINEVYDTSSVPFHNVLTVFDSTVTNTSGQYVFVNPRNPGVILLKAALQPSDPSYSNFLPTYHDSSLLWSGANYLDIFMIGTHSTTTNVSLRGGINPGGPAFIGGNVLLGANKPSGVGDPLNQRIVMLTTAAGQAVTYAYSDVNGRFSFNNLPYGSYKLFGDAWGKDNPALDITLSAQSPAIGDVIFEENSTSFKGHLNSLTVQNSPVLSTITVFPNPVKDFVELSGLKEDAKITLRDVSGKILPCNPQYRGNLFYIPSINLAAGMYFLEVHAGAFVANVRFTKE